MCGGGDAPAPSDPGQTATTQQEKYNRPAYEQTMLGNAMNQTTPFGTLSYTPTRDAAGNLVLNATQTLSPENQQLLTSLYGSKNLAGAGAGNVLQGAYTGTPNIYGGADSLMGQRLGAQLDYLNPFFERQTDQLDARLRNQGLAPGTEAYNNAMNDLRQSQGQTMTGATAQFMPEAFSEAMQAYKMPAEMATTLSNLGAPLGLGLTNTPTGTMNAADYQGAVQAADRQKMEAWKAEQEQKNQMINGIMSTVGSMAGAAMMMSDRKMKKDIKRVGVLFNGIPVYSFKYKAGGPTQLGLMAQDVEKINPEAVAEICGIKHVDYAKATRSPLRAA